MTYDPTISLGSILILVGNIGLFLIYIIRLEGKINLLTFRTSTVEQTVKALAQTDSRLATIDERIASHGKMLATAQSDISDLRKGKGWIQGPQGIDREYP